MASDDGTDLWTSFVEPGLWVVGALLGPIPWILLATDVLAFGWGSTGYSVAFLTAPGLWTLLATAGLLVDDRRWTIALAVLGTLLWFAL